MSTRNHDTRAQRLVRIGEAVLARPNGLRQCANSGCGLFYRPSYGESKFCSVCVRAGKHLEPRYCAYEPCGVAFQPHFNTELYHTDTCRQFAYNDRKKEPGFSPTPRRDRMKKRVAA